MRPYNRLPGEPRQKAFYRAGGWRMANGSEARSLAPGGYNSSFYCAVKTIMEAEQLNIIANRLADLTQRTAELRRYL